MTLMVRDPDDLDAEIFEHHCTARIETSLTLDRFAEKLRTEPGISYRDGLGRWDAYSIDLSSYGKMFIAAPAGNAEAGCSIWYRPGNDLDHGTVAALVLYQASNPDDALFIDPDTGDPVVPKRLTLSTDLPGLRSADDRNAAAKNDLKFGSW